MTRIWLPAISADSPLGGWADYWEEFSAEDCFHREPARLYLEKLASAIVLRPDMRVLDFGCGFGFTAEMLADQVSEVWVWDAAAAMRLRTQKLLAHRSNCHFLDESDPRAAARQPQFDLILVNSVVQYMCRHQFAARLAQWRQCLAPGGQVLVSDLIAPKTNVFVEMFELLQFSLRRQLFLQTLRQLGRGILTYLKYRNAHSLTCYDHKELATMGESAGLCVTFLRENLTHFSQRSTACFSNASGAFHA